MGFRDSKKAFKSHRCCNGISCVAFEVLIINYQIDFINLFIFNCLNINLLIFNCLTPNLCFPKNISYASRRERLLMEARPKFRLLNSSRKMMTCDLRDTIKLLRHHTLFTSIHTFFISSAFISNARLKLAKSQANTKQQNEVLLFENFSLFSSIIMEK